MLGINNVNTISIIFKYSLLLLPFYVLIIALTIVFAHRIVDKIEEVFGYIIIVYYTFSYTVYYLSDIVEFNRVLGVFSSSIVIVASMIYGVVMWATGTSSKSAIVAFVLLIFTLGVVGVPMVWVK